MATRPDEIREALDNVQRLMMAPLPGPRARQEMLQQIYRILRKMLPEDQQLEHESVEVRPEVDLADDPVLGGILDLTEDG
jgi:SpoVK/Ycf46/Vps4 family AAA+-type ATPase